MQIKSQYESCLHVQNNADEAVIKILGDDRFINLFNKKMERHQVEMYAREYKEAILKLHTENVEADYKTIQDRFREFTKDKIEIIDEGVKKLLNLKDILLQKDGNALLNKICAFNKYLDYLDRFYKEY